LLLDGAATKESILRELEHLRQRCDNDSTVLVYFSGHGGSITSGVYTGEYLLPVEASNASQQSLADTSISGEQFTKALHVIPARQLVVFLDCCHAAGIGHVKGEAAADDSLLLDDSLLSLKSGLTEEYFKALQTGTGRAVYSSSRADEKSWVMPGDDNSLFTKHLLAGLDGGVESDDGFVRIFELLEYVRPRVLAEIPIQHPVLRFDGEENLPIGLYRGGETGEKSSPTDGFRFDAYVSYVEKQPDRDWVLKKLMPHLGEAGLKAAVSRDIADPRVAYVVNMERGVQQARNTILVISKASLDDAKTMFEGILRQTEDIEEGQYSLLPVYVEDVPRRSVPLRLRALGGVNLSDPAQADEELERLVRALRNPVPEM
jgi:hypothetical protein